MKNNINKIVDLLKKEQCFYLVSHILPDGDSIGSLLALGEALRQMGKEVRLLSPHPVSKRYIFLEGSSSISQELAYDHCSTVVVLDSSDLERTGQFKEQLAGAQCLVNIDHHPTNRNYGTLNLVEPGAAATGELLYHLFISLGVKITGSMAAALYVAIATDTGSFKYDNTTPETHRIVAALLEQGGLNPAWIAQRIFDERPLSFFLLLKEALATLEIDNHLCIATLAVGSDMLEKYNVSIEEIEGLINFTRNIEGVELGILFYVESDREIKVGFRSKKADVSILAGRLNGGGHARAAGCRLSGSYAEVKQMVLREARNLLQEAGLTGDLYERDHQS